MLSHETLKYKLKNDKINMTGRDHMEVPLIYGRITLKWILEENGGCRLNSHDS